MKQGEIWFANLNPTEGSEQAGLRPVLIVSGNIANEFAPVVICCPLTTKIKNYKGDLILEPNKQNGLKKESEVMTIHIRSLAKSRLKERIGTIDKTAIAALKQSIQEVLTF